MRTGTILVLLGAILMFAYFGWAAFGYLVLTFLVLLALGVVAVAVGIWAIKRRMRERMRELGQAFEDRLRAQQAAAGRSGAIDVEATVRRPRDGADEPEAMDPGKP